jgi:hypothetical protein
MIICQARLSEWDIYDLQFGLNSNATTATTNFSATSDHVRLQSALDFLYRYEMAKGVPAAVLTVQSHQLGQIPVEQYRTRPMNGWDRRLCKA